MSFSNDGGNWAIRSQSTANVFQKSINSFQKIRNVDTLCVPSSSILPSYLCKFSFTQKKQTNEKLFSLWIFIDFSGNQCPGGRWRKRDGHLPLGAVGDQINHQGIAVAPHDPYPKRCHRYSHCGFGPVVHQLWRCRGTASVQRVKLDEYDRWSRQRATSVTIGSQVWQLKNLNVDRYRNGDPIPKVEDGATWMSLTTGAYCYYNNDSATYAAAYGKLNNWYAVNDSRGLAPTGYHVPSYNEWQTMIATAGGSSLAGPALKETGTVYWDTDPGSTNSTGFSARGGGFRDNNSGNFYYLRTFSYLWDATPQGGNTAYFHGPFSSGAHIYANPYPYNCGFSVRLIKE